MIRMKYQALFSLKNIFQMLSAVVVISALMVNIKNGTTFFTVSSCLPCISWEKARDDMIYC